MEDQITTDRLNESGDPTTETQNADQLQSVRAELITLAEKHEIKHSVAYIKKASQGALEKLKETTKENNWKRRTITYPKP